MSEIQKIVAANMALGTKPYPIKRIGSLRLKRSIFNQDEARKMTLQLDNDSMLLLSTEALKLGLTPDEYLRQIVWSL